MMRLLPHATLAYRRNTMMFKTVINNISHNAIKSLFSTTTLIAMTVLLSACSGMTPRAQVQMSIEEIEWHSEQPSFDQAAKNQLNAWLSRYPVRDIRLKINPNSENYSQIKSHLISAGIAAPKIEHFDPATSLPNKFNFIAGLVIQRSIPKCPNWTVPNMADSQVGQSSNFGCASERNLSMMVADPSDLIRGKTLAGASAEHSINALDRYYRRTTDQAEPEENPEPLIAPVITEN